MNKINLPKECNSCKRNLQPEDFGKEVEIITFKNDATRFNVRCPFCERMIDYVVVYLQNT